MYIRSQVEDKLLVDNRHADTQWYILSMRTEQTQVSPVQNEVESTDGSLPTVLCFRFSSSSGGFYSK